MSLFPQIYDPDQIKKMIGFGLMSDGVIVREFNHETVSTWWSEEDQYDTVPARQIMEAAYRTRREWAEECPSNCFRTTSPMMKHDDWSYQFNVELTDAGWRARECARVFQCCDDDGYVAEDATVQWWLARLAKIPAYSYRYEVSDLIPMTRSWIGRSWAERVQQAFRTLEAYVAINDQGEPDVEKTLQDFMKLETTALMAYRDYFARKEAPWAIPVRDYIAQVYLSLPVGSPELMRG